MGNLARNRTHASAALVDLWCYHRNQHQYFFALCAGKIRVALTPEYEDGRRKRDSFRQRTKLSGKSRQELSGHQQSQLQRILFKTRDVSSTKERLWLENFHKTKSVFQKTALRLQSKRNRSGQSK